MVIQHSASYSVSYLELEVRIRAAGVNNWTWPSVSLCRRRVASFGHMARHMTSILAWEPEGSRPRGRPPLRLFEVVKADLGAKHMKGISRTDMIIAAQDRDLWCRMLD